MIIELKERYILKLIKVASHCKVFLEISVHEILKTMKNCSYSMQIQSKILIEELILIKPTDEKPTK